jgi:hypothetical protein
MKTAAGRNKLAAAISIPLRQRRDYFSVGRKGLYVEELPDGALPIFDTDPAVGAFFGGEDGDSVVNRAGMDRVVYDLFEVYANPTEKLYELKNRRFDLLDRLKVKGSSLVQLKEDTQFFNLLEAAAQANPAGVQTAAGSSIVGADLSDMFGLVESPDLSVARVFMNARDYADIRKLGRDYLDFETQRALLKAGILGDLWGAKVIRTRAITAGNVYFCTEPEFLGRISERIPLTVLPDDRIGDRRIGFSIFEYIAMGIHNPLGVIKMTVTRA